MDLNMRQDAQTLAHFYAGFAGIVRVVLRGEGKNLDHCQPRGCLVRASSRTPYRPR
jgi:hypothetical protein